MKVGQLLTVLILGSAMAPAMATKVAVFECNSTLEYQSTFYGPPSTETVLRQMPITVTGAVNSAGIMTDVIRVQVGDRTEYYRGHSGSVSPGMINISGYAPDHGFSLYWAGENSAHNWVSWDYESGSFRIRALNEVLAGPDAGRDYPVECHFSSEF